MNVLKIPVEGGWIQGYQDKESVRIFKGIPYAAPPVGSLRFCPPQPVIGWEDVRDCTKFGPISVQREGSGWGGIPVGVRQQILDENPLLAAMSEERAAVGKEGISPWTEEYADFGKTLENGLMSEDCLYLNVWTCAKEGEKLPVFFYIHGGGNEAGSGTLEVYHGNKLAQQGVVVVTMNYRLGALGFMAYKDRTGDEIRGNFAIMDQIAALKWVQRNIAAFGGDPDRVTIGGQSAGSGNCQTLIASPAAKGLFHQMICMSGNNYVSSPFRLHRADKLQEEVREKLGDYLISELRAMPVTDFYKLTQHMGIQGACIDDEIVTQDLRQAYESGNFNHGNMLFGSVREDCTLFNSLKLMPGENPMLPLLEMSPERYVQKIRFSLPDQAEQCLELYPANQDNMAEQMKDMLQDNMILGYYEAMKSKAATDPTHRNYIYNFTHVVPDTETCMKANGAFHTGDVGYWFDIFTKAYPRPWTDEDYKLGDRMSGYLTNFVKTGNPNGTTIKGETLPAWKDVSSYDSLSYLELDETIEWKTIDEKKASFWKNI